MRVPEVSNFLLYVIRDGNVQLHAVGTGRNPKAKIQVTGQHRKTQQEPLYTADVRRGPFFKTRLSRSATKAANAVKEASLIAEGVKPPRKILLVDQIFPQHYEARLNRVGE